MENENELDPRIQVELENLNIATDEINKLEIELEEANSTFGILLNESTRRLKLSSKKLGSCIEKARPYYEACEKARVAQIECQAAAVKFRQANELHAAAKETVALAEARFISKSHEWQFDNAWQETLNYNTMKVMTAEKEKADCHLEHQKKANIFSATEITVQQLEDRFRRSIQKSRPYFEEKQICQDQLRTQKERIQELQSHIQISKTKYSTSLRNLERISEDIHKMRGNLCNTGPPGPREPGVGAELNHIPTEHIILTTKSTRSNNNNNNNNNNNSTTLDYLIELEKCDISSISTSRAISEKDDDSDNNNDDDDNDNNNNNNNSNKNNNIDINNKSNDINDLNLEELTQRFKVLAVRPVEGGDGQQTQVDVWENELNDTVAKLDRLMMIRDGNSIPTINQNISLPNSPIKNLPATSMQQQQQPNKLSASSTLSLATPIKKLQTIEPLPNVNVSMRELPLLARISNGILERTVNRSQNKRRLSLE